MGVSGPDRVTFAKQHVLTADHRPISFRTEVRDAVDRELRNAAHRGSDNRKGPHLQLVMPELTPWDAADYDAGSLSPIIDPEQIRCK